MTFSLQLYNKKLCRMSSRRFRHAALFKLLVNADHLVDGVDHLRVLSWSRCNCESEEFCFVSRSLKRFQLSMFIRVQSLAAVTPAEGAATVTTTEAIIVSSEEDAEKTLSETLDA
jgi:hypothetical protein